VNHIHNYLLAQVEGLPSSVISIHAEFLQNIGHAILPVYNIEGHSWILHEVADPDHIKHLQTLSNGVTCGSGQLSCHAGLLSFAFGAGRKEFNDIHAQIANQVICDRCPKGFSRQEAATLPICDQCAVFDTVVLGVAKNMNCGISCEVKGLPDGAAAVRFIPNPESVGFRSHVVQVGSNKEITIKQSIPQKRAYVRELTGTVIGVCQLTSIVKETCSMQNIEQHRTCLYCQGLHTLLQSTHRKNLTNESKLLQRNYAPCSDCPRVPLIYEYYDHQRSLCLCSMDQQTYSDENLTFRVLSSIVKPGSKKIGSPAVVIEEVGPEKLCLLMHTSKELMSQYKKGDVVGFAQLMCLTSNFLFKPRHFRIVVSKFLQQSKSRYKRTSRKADDTNQQTSHYHNQQQNRHYASPKPRTDLVYTPDRLRKAISDATSPLQSDCQNDTNLKRKREDVLVEFGQTPKKPKKVIKKRVVRKISKSSRKSKWFKKGKPNNSNKKCSN